MKEAGPTAPPSALIIRNLLQYYIKLGFQLDLLTEYTYLTFNT